MGRGGPGGGPVRAGDGRRGPAPTRRSRASRSATASRWSRHRSTTRGCATSGRPSWSAPDGSLGAVDWVFNGWGAQRWATWDKDTRIASFVAARAGAPRILSDLVNEGGGIHVDGLGTVLLTETVQLDPGRNPGLGAGRGRGRDGAHHRRDDLHLAAARADPRLRRVRHPRARRHRRDVRVTGRRAAALAGRPGRTPTTRCRSSSRGCCRRRATPAVSCSRSSGCPRPRPSRTTRARSTGRYINHLVVNGGVVACTFDDPQDADSLAVLERAYAGRRVVGVDARPLFARGGGIHCITQQQPRV